MHTIRPLERTNHLVYYPAAAWRTLGQPPSVDGQSDFSHLEFRAFLHLAVESTLRIVSDATGTGGSSRVRKNGDLRP